jgi:hypothetical protein|tara:strand:- start:91 stop:774 length:684 start_codon:yes stop_codon:yes gene_type:complete
MTQNYTMLIEKKQLQIADLQKTQNDLMNDPNIIPPNPKPIIQGSKDCPKRCEHWDGGNLSCRHHCGLDHFRGNDRQRELRQIAIKRHITPITNQIKNAEKEIIVLQEKAKLPLLRQQLLTATSEYQELSPNDPEFRQKQIDQKKLLYEKAVALDTLERKHNLFGNLPPVRQEREIIEVTPDPITVYKEPEIIQKSLTIGTADFNYKKLAIAGAGIFAVLALILWRFK